MKTVIEMAREAGFDGVGQRVTSPVIEGSDLAWLLERFAELVRADEREACAKVCEVLAVHPEYASEVTKLAAMAIRNRSNT